MSSDRLREEHVKKTLEKIQSIENQVDNPHYNLSKEEEFKVHIEIDDKVAHGMFKPNPKKEGNWLASSQTFRAMKKDIFALDDQMIELQDNYQCTSCKTLLDRQFWHFCPYCGSSFLS